MVNLLILEVEIFFFRHVVDNVTLNYPRNANVKALINILGFNEILLFYEDNKTFANQIIRKLNVEKGIIYKNLMLFMH